MDMLNPYDDKFIEAAAQAIRALNDALVGHGTQSVMGDGRLKVHAAIGDVADQIRDYIRQRREAAARAIAVKP